MSNAAAGKGLARSCATTKPTPPLSFPPTLTGHDEWLVREGPGMREASHDQSQIAEVLARVTGEEYAVGAPQRAQAALWQAFQGRRCSMKKIPTSRDASTLSDAIKPLLAGQPPEIQGAVLADLSVALARRPSGAVARRAARDAYRDGAEAGSGKRTRDVRPGRSSAEWHGWAAMSIVDELFLFRKSRR